MNRILTIGADLTRELNDYFANTRTFNATTRLYVSSDYPFNQIFFDLPTPEAGTVNVTTKYWDGGEFRDTVDQVDETYGMTQSGFLTWTPNRNYGWKQERDSSDISELSSYIIYDKYWMEITIEATALEVNWLGSVFSDDDDLDLEYQDLARFKDNLGLTSWFKQHIRAAEIMIGELKRRRWIADKSQILNYRDFSPASVQMVAKIIFNELGPAYAEQRDEATKEYNSRMAKLVPKTDQNNNAIDEKTDIADGVGITYL